MAAAGALPAPAEARSSFGWKRFQAFLDQWWAPAFPLALMVISDHQIRTRGDDQSISGRADLVVLLEIIVYGAVALFLLHRAGRIPRIHRLPRTLFAAWAFAVVLAASALYSPFLALGIVRGAQLIVTATLATALAFHANRVDFHRMAHGFLVVVAVSVGIGVVHPFERRTFTQDRFNWLYTHQVVVAIYLGIAVLLALHYALRYRTTRSGPRWPLPVYLAFLALNLGALVATETRGAAGACVVGAAVYAVAATTPRRRLDLLILGGVAVVITWMLWGSRVIDFVVRDEPVERLATLNSRTDLWAVALDAAAEQPLFGYGLGASRGLFLEATNLGGGHNALVNVFVDAGIIGGLLFCWLLLLLVLHLIVLCRSERTAEGPLLLAVLAFLVVDSVTTEHLAVPANVASVWLFILAAYAVVLARASGLRSSRSQLRPGKAPHA